MPNLKKMKLLLTGMTLLTLGSSSLHAASFNCRKASTAIEKTICEDRYLNELDEDMGRLYHKAKNYQHDLPKYQKEWIKNRNSECGANTDCLYKWTESRIINFNNIIKDAKAGVPVNAPKKKHTSNAVYFPEHGILCDKKSGFCADSEGISMGYTKEYLGQAVQDKWDKMIERDHMETFDFTLSNGIYCNAKKKKCYTEKFGSVVDKHFTNNLFR